jgi:hypothetical protein
VIRNWIATSLASVVLVSLTTVVARADGGSLVDFVGATSATGQFDSQSTPTANVWVVLRNSGPGPATVKLQATVMGADGTVQPGILRVSAPAGPIALAAASVSDPERVTIERVKDLPRGAKTYLVAGVSGSDGADFNAALLPLTLQPAPRSDLPSIQARGVLALGLIGAILAIGSVFAITGLGRHHISYKVSGKAKWDRGSWVSTLTAVGAALGGIFNLSGALPNDPQILAKADYTGLNFTFIALAAVGAAVYAMTTQEDPPGSGNFFTPLGWFLFSTAFALCAAAGTLITAGLYLAEVALQGSLDPVIIVALALIWAFGAIAGALYAVRSVAKLVAVQVTPPVVLPRETAQGAQAAESAEAVGAARALPIPPYGVTLKSTAAKWRRDQGAPSPTFSAI